MTNKTNAIKNTSNMIKTTYGYSIIFLFATLFFFSCSKRAESLDKQLQQQEQKAKEILIGEAGTESKKLQFFIDEQYDSVLAVTAEQQAEFDKIIADIEALPSDDLTGAPALKITAVAYYNTLKSLYGYAKEEAIQQQLLINASEERQKELQDGLLQLAKDKQALFQAVYKGEENYTNAKKEFEKTHGLKR